MLLAAGAFLHHRRAVSRAMERGVLPGKLRHRRQAGDGHGAEAIATRSSMSESATRCVIVGNMEVSQRRVASPATNMEASHRRVASPATNMEASHRRVAAPATNMEASLLWRHGEGTRGVPLNEASGDGDNRHDKMTLAVICVLHRRHRRPQASKEE